MAILKSSSFGGDIMLVILACDGAGRTKTWKMEGEIPQLRFTVDTGNEGTKGFLAGEEIPASLQTPIFLEAWTDWIAFRRKNRWSTKPSFLALKIKTFSEWGPEDAAVAMRQSIEQNYQGTFKPNQFTRRHVVKAMKPEIPEMKGGVPF